MYLTHIILCRIKFGKINPISALIKMTMKLNIDARLSLDFLKYDK